MIRIAVDEQDRGAPHHQRAHLVEEAEIGDAPGRERDEVVVAHEVSETDHQQIADQEAVDRLAHDHRVLADIDEQQQHQLAGEQHGRARRGDDPERQRDIEDAGEIGLEEMHHAERAEERADAEAMAAAEQAGQDCEIKESVAGQQQHILPFGHRTSRLPLAAPYHWRILSPSIFVGPGG